MICGTAAQLKRFCPGMQLVYPGMMSLCGPNMKFRWNPDHQKELEDLKQCLKKHIKLSPIDVKKNLKLIIDAAATVCCSYLLMQDKSDNPEGGYNLLQLVCTNVFLMKLNIWLAGSKPGLFYSDLRTSMYQ